ncbi:response regulator transcription factor [Thalassoroseus pseudoceratinae]|uniref:response regulator transcription factor n=1 Tax=Thalassoroseus pseudoceratinae TaxID=2713176 RepID=UPI0014201205|nr:response regulator transcription factor [Thalassoroseus pseudoceratinae]
MKILIVEDEIAMATGLKFNFEQEGYEVTHVADGRSAVELFEQEESPADFDVIVLDLMLPGMSGYEACRRIRSLQPNLPILVLSARSLSEDRSAAFDAGTNQYLTKPFDLRELLSRVRNLVNQRQHRPEPPTEQPSKNTQDQVFEFGDVRFDLGRFTLAVGDAVYELTGREAELLDYFIRHEGHVLSRSRILKDVWGESEELATRTIDNFVLRLRKMLEPNPADPRYILSVRGTGYRFVKPDSQD